ncbi:hypothetical protein H9651_13115 [Microbacterium sp. Sa4CUA7]|uniref:OmpR/PhoB-type domain-containing protein n=1 Tax=Microbacterium pullorum TaxID=2762236 RepID=A0ABR8S532_9MICO|nr:hypothetical protein [Microbacterium pullorum]MBD7958584.1 hypothetical protein [Microbacterium pullorum]
MIAVAEHGPIRVRLLGRVTVTIGARPVPIGGPRVQALLACLLLARGRTLSADALMSEVWGRATPGIRSALRADVSRLRTTALGEHVVGGRQGYAVTPHVDLDVDLWRIADAVEAPAPPTSALLAELVIALESLPLDGCGASPFVPGARAQAQVSARRAAMRAVAAHPRHTLALPLAERLAAREPNDPELRALLLATRTGFSPGPTAGASAGHVTPAAPTRRIGVPAPIAAYQPRPEDEFRLAAALRLSRLVSLVGPAGVGTSRLAIEWARGPSSAGQEHVWFCRRRAGLRSWLDVVAHAVGAPASTLAGVTSRLERVRGTIVLDGFDAEPIDAAVDWAALLEGCPGLSLLVTARRPLGVAGESVLRLEALSVADARALFRLRAPAALPVADGVTAQIDAVVAALGRLPLAIELAAARAAHVPLDSVVDALSAPASGGGADSLHTAVSATLAGLGAGDPETLSLLCVFRGRFDADSAAAVVGAAAARSLETLRSWALLSDESGEGHARYRVPEFVRRRIALPDEPREVQTRHTQWFAARTLAAFDELTTHSAAAAGQRLEADRADIDAAFERAVACGDRENALGIAAGLSWLGLVSGSQSAALALARRAAQVPGEAAPVTEAKAGLGRGVLAYQLACMGEARSALERARHFASRTGDPDLIGLDHAFRAYLATLMPEGAGAAITAIRMARRQLTGASLSTQAMVALVSAQVERTVGDHASALRFTGSARDLAQDAGHDWVSLMARVVAAKVLIDMRAPRRALNELRAALGDARVVTDPISVLIATSVAAGAAASVGSDAAGARIIGAVDAIGPRYGFDPRANEPGDFERYRRRVREGLTDARWRDAYLSGSALNLAELVEHTRRLSSRGTGRD